MKRGQQSWATKVSGKYKIRKNKKMSAPYKYIVNQIKENLDLYENLVKHGKELDEDEIIEKRKLEKLYSVILDMEEMSEEKYYVEDLMTQGAWLGKDVYGVVSGGYLKQNRSTFSKTELSEINNGALYKRKWRDLRNDIDFGEGWEMKSDDEKGKSYWEWINPLIKLVPVKE